MFEEPELHVVGFPPPDPSWQEEREQQRVSALARCTGLLSLGLVELGLPAGTASSWGEVLAQTLFTVTDVENGEPCSCSCHPQLPSVDAHEGETCRCQQSAEERDRSHREWLAAWEAGAESPEALAALAERQAEEDEVAAWLAGEPDVVVTSFGGLAPELWEGSVDGRSFFFRERHGLWRIELDLRPSGRSVSRWTGGDLDDDSSFEPVELDSGDVVAEGVAGCEGYGSRPVERGQHIVRTVREHVAGPPASGTAATWTAWWTSSASGPASARRAARGWADGSSARGTPECDTRREIRRPRGERCRPHRPLGRTRATAAILPA